MAVVGDAYIVVRALTDRVKDDIRDGFKGSDRIGEQAGRDAGDGLSRGFRRSSGNSSNMFRNLARNADEAREKFNRLIQIGYAVGPAIAALTSVIGGAASGLFALGAQAAAAGPALMSLIGVFSAVAQGAAVLKVAFSGVGAALSAGLNAGGGGGGGGAANLARQIESANKRIEDAEKRLAQVRNENARRLKTARDQVERAARGVVDAQNAEIDANKDLTRAENELTRAKERTAEAREQAREDIQQLNFALEDAVLTEERAALKLEDARDALAKVANLPPNNRQRREAELAFKEAELRLRRAKDSTSDTQKEVNEANQKGVEGSDRVIAALDRERAANENVEDAKTDVERATLAVADAKEAEKDAWNNLSAVIEENKSRVADAKDAIKEAKQALKDLKNGANSAGGGVDRFAEAMAKLSPEAQGFVRDLLDLAPAWEEIKFLTQDALFGTLRDDLAELTDVWFPKLRDLMPGTAKAVGTVASRLTDVFTNAGNVDRLERIWKDNDKNIEDLGGAVANLADSFLILLDNARPLTRELSQWLEKITGGWKNTLEAKDKTGELADIFDYAGGVAKTLGGIIGNVFRTIGNIGKAAAGPGSGGETLLNLLSDVTARWEEFTGSVEGQNRLEDFFNDIVPLVSEIGGLIADIFGAIFRQTEATTGETTSFVGSLREVVGTIEDMGPALAEALPTIGEFLEKAAEAINNLTSSGAIDTFFSVLRDAAGIFSAITGSPFFQQIFLIVAPIFAAQRGLALVLKFLRFIFLGTIVGSITKLTGVFNLFSKAIFLVKKRAALLRLAFIKFPKTMGLLKLAFGPVGLAVAGLVAAFIAMWNESEIFREAIKDLIDNVLKVLGEVFNDVKAAVEEALVPFGGMEGIVDKLKTAFKFLGDIIGTYVIPIVQFIVTFFIKQLGFVIVKIIQAIGFLWRAWKTAFDIIYAVVETVVNWFRDTVWPIIKSVIDFIVGYYKFLWSIVQFVWNAIYSAIETVVNWFRDYVWPVIRFVINFIKGYFNILSIIIQKVWATIMLAIELFVNWFRDTVWPIIENVINWIKDGFETVKNKLQAAWDFIRYKVIRPVVDWLRDNIWPIIETVWNNISDGIETVRGVLERVWNKIKGVVDTAVAAIKGFIEPIWDGIVSAFETVRNKLIGGPGGQGGIWGNLKDKISGIVNGIKGFFTGLWDGLTNGLTTAVSSVKRTLNNMIRFINGVINGANLLPGPDIPTIPLIPLARGGIVNPRSGGTMALLAEAGRAERVEPLDENGLSNRDKAMISYLTGGQGGGTTINVYPAPGMDERELAQKVSRELALQVRRGAL